MSARSVKGLKRVANASLSGDSVAMNKLSHVELSSEQRDLKNNVLQFTRDNLNNYKDGDLAAMYEIQGDVETGKSVILNFLFKEVQRLANDGVDSDDSENVLHH